nr:DUF262 domain-containing protein [uncultured Dongia sp.]
MAELNSLPMSVQTIYSWFREDRLFVNRRYQRKLVWTLEEKQRLIESILKKYPIPAILIAEKNDSPGSYEIIDGLQRLHAIVSFIETSFATLQQRYFNLEHFPTAKSYADEGKFEPTKGEKYLTPKDVSTILDYSLAFSVMRNASEEDVNDVFGRINTYGHRLSDQERRQAGVQNEFSVMVRDLACSLRGDVSSPVLLLRSMPSISIDLPMTKHGYEIQAEEVFWVEQGILRSTDLRDSMDEQCIADISACIVGGQLIERSKDALDDIYSEKNPECVRILKALEDYGAEQFSDEFKFCIQEIIKICSEDRPEKLREIVFEKKTTNAFPSVFAVLLVAVHELLIGAGQKISNYQGAKKAIRNLSNRIAAGRKATSSEERQKNVDTIKGLLQTCCVKTKKQKKKIYNNYTTIDIEASIRRSEIELANYELKQGLLKLEPKGGVDPGIIDKIVKTICGMANIGPHSSGCILIGVVDKAKDASRIEEIDKIKAKKFGRRFIVGVDREAKRLGIAVEKYFEILRDGIANSKLSDALKGAVLANIDYNSFFGMGMIVITVPPQKDLSYIGNEVFWRSADATVSAKNPKEIAEIAKRF